MESSQKESVTCHNSATVSTTFAWKPLSSVDICSSDAIMSDALPEDMDPSRRLSMERAAQIAVNLKTISHDSPSRIPHPKPCPPPAPPFPHQCPSSPLLPPPNVVPGTVEQSAHLPSTVDSKHQPSPPLCTDNADDQSSPSSTTSPVPIPPPLQPTPLTPSTPSPRAENPSSQPASQEESSASTRPPSCHSDATPPSTSTHSQTSSDENLGDRYGLYVFERHPISQKPLWLVCQFCTQFSDAPGRKGQKVMAYVAPFDEKSMRNHVEETHAVKWPKYCALPTAAERKGFLSKGPIKVDAMEHRVTQLKIAWNLFAPSDVDSRVRLMKRGIPHGSKLIKMVFRNYERREAKKRKTMNIDSEEELEVTLSKTQPPADRSEFARKAKSDAKRKTRETLAVLELNKDPLSAEEKTLRRRAKRAAELHRGVK